MRFKLIMALADEACTEDILAAARDAGVTGCTVITSARGEGLKPGKTFLGLELNSQRDLSMFLVAEPLARDILEAVAKAGKFEEEPGSGITFQIAVEDAIGMSSQLTTLTQEIDEQL
ncbi:MAG: P-II family nitrogen regulator [Alphaproteobacteria bacterium]